MRGLVSSSADAVEIIEDFDEDQDEDEEAWRLRREGDSSTRLDFIKRLLAISFFAGLGIIVIFVAATATPLLTSAAGAGNVTSTSP